jgi:hypothetical protein
VGEQLCSGTQVPLSDPIAAPQRCGYKQGSPKLTGTLMASTARREKHSASQASAIAFLDAATCLEKSWDMKITENKTTTYYRLANLTTKRPGFYRLIKSLNKCLTNISAGSVTKLAKMTASSAYGISIFVSVVNWQVKCMFYLWLLRSAQAKRFPLCRLAFFFFYRSSPFTLNLWIRTVSNTGQVSSVYCTVAPKRSRSRKASWRGGILSQGPAALTRPPACSLQGGALRGICFEAARCSFCCWDNIASGSATKAAT